MKVPYPKHPKNIPIRIIHQDIDEGLLSPIKTVAEVALSEKLNDYVIRLGYSSTYIMGIMIQLMSSTKVQVDFTEYTERLELVNLGDRLSSPQAISLLEDYIEEVGTRDKTEAPASNRTTQRIVIRAYRPPKPGK
jgi:hypothetical protein